MKSKLRIACAALLATAATQAMALQLGQIQVKSALNQPLVAAIPLHPKNLTELEGLTVALAPAADFTRAGLQLTSTDQMLRFHVVTDNNGQKLILVTSSQPVTDPYLDFLVQVNTRQGKQVREFVVLLNPIIAAPAPVVQAAPVAAAPATQAVPVAAAPAVQAAPVAPAPILRAQPQPQPAQPQPSLEFPPPLVAPNKPAAASVPKPANATPKAQPKPQLKPQPKPQSKPHSKPQSKPQSEPQSKPQTRPQPATPSRQSTIAVAHGDTLYGIARQHTSGTRGGINQMMLALKAANPDAFFKDNIDNLKAGAILRIPTRDEIDKISVAEANAEVHRQYEAWRAARPHPATVLAGSAATAAARSAPKPDNTAPASDHLSLTPPTGKRGSVNNRPGVAGGTGTQTVAGLGLQLQNDRGSLISLNQSNADLTSRVQSLKAIAGKSDKLLSFKDATVAELQRKLAAVQAGRTGAAMGSSTGTAASGSSIASSPANSAVTMTNAATKTPHNAHSSIAKKSHAAVKPGARASQAVAQPWYQRPIAWLIAGLVVLALILIGLFTRKRRPDEPAAARGPLPDPEDVSGNADAIASPETPSDEEALYARLAEHPGDLDIHLDLCRLFYTHDDADRFVEAAEAMHEEVTDSECVEWREVRVMGDALAPQHPLFAEPADVAAPDDPYGLTSSQQSAADTDDATIVIDHRSVAPADEQHARTPAPTEIPATPTARANSVADEPAFSDDPVDTKLDLARAYLDMGDPVGARAMLEEVIEEGSQTQMDEAKRLLAEAEASD